MGSSGENGNAVVTQNGHSEVGSTADRFSGGRSPGEPRDGFCDGFSRQGTTDTTNENVKPLTIRLSLRDVLSDPSSGSFLEDAMVANCGHSFGGVGLKRVIQTGVCLTCAASVAVDSLIPNYALREAVKAYLQQETSPSGCTKRKRDENDEPQNSGCKKAYSRQLNSSNNTLSEGQKPKGVQFPFSVNDHVLIKGNKRTPERFFGREAIITSQCLNGWYLVKTLDGGESIRLQYRSLKKLDDRQQSSEHETSLSSQEVAKTSCSPEMTEAHQSVSKCLLDQLAEYRDDRQDNDREQKSICSAVSLLVKVEAQAAEAVRADLLPQRNNEESETAEKQPEQPANQCNDVSNEGDLALTTADPRTCVVAGTTEDISKNSSVESDDQSCKLETVPLSVENNQGSVFEAKQDPPGVPQRSKKKHDFMRAIRREMLQLEKVVPWNLLSLSWMNRRLEWRCRVRQSVEIKDLGPQLDDFRQNLLLNSAGGMSDAEWEKELSAALHSKDAEPLLLLWRKLNDDVYKLLDSKARNVQRVQGDDKTQELDLGELQTAFPNLQVEGMSPVSIIAAAILASADAIARGEKEAEEILEIPMKLIQQHGHKQLSSVREALEREKRHITARLSRLVEAEETEICSFRRTARKGPYHSERALQESDAAAAAVAASDGEATDMSDS